MHPTCPRARNSGMPQLGGSNSASCTQQLLRCQNLRPSLVWLLTVSLGSIPQSSHHQYTHMASDFSQYVWKCLGERKPRHLSTSSSQVPQNATSYPGQPCSVGEGTTQGHETQTIKEMEEAGQMRSPVMMEPRVQTWTLWL